MVKKLTVKQFRDKYHPQLSLEGIRYAMKRHLDYERLGRDFFIKLTTKTLLWKPRKFKKHGQKTT